MNIPHCPPIHLSLLPILSWILIPNASCQFEESFEPHVSAEQAIATARLAFAKHKFAAELFEISSVEYKKQIFTEEQLEEIKQNPDKEFTRNILKEFGNGPAWIVTYWRTKRVSHTGNWFDDIQFGIQFYVFQNNRVAIFDQRVVEFPADKRTSE